MHRRQSCLVAPSRRPRTSGRDHRGEMRKLHPGPPLRRLALHAHSPVTTSHLHGPAEYTSTEGVGKTHEKRRWQQEQGGADQKKYGKEAPDTSFFLSAPAGRHQAQWRDPDRGGGVACGGNTRRHTTLRDRRAGAPTTRGDRRETSRRSGQRASGGGVGE